MLEKRRPEKALSIVEELQTKNKPSKQCRVRRAIIVVTTRMSVHEHEDRHSHEHC